MSRYKLNHDVVVNGAMELINERGAEALSLAEVAARFHVRTPSLYNHVQSLDGLRRDLSLLGLRSLSAQLQTTCTGLAGYDALKALAVAYRAFAQANPGLYPLTLRPVGANDEELRNVHAQLDRLFHAALRGYKLQGDAAVHAVRAVRSALHGFMILEGNGDFGRDGEDGNAVSLDASYNALVELLDQGLARRGNKN